MRVLVTYGSKRGGTEGLAQMVTGGLREEGLTADLLPRVGARGHATFGGRLTPDAKGFPASAMAKKHAGDWRDAGQVRAWAGSVAAQLQAGVRSGL